MTRVLLTIEHQLHAQLLKHAFADCPDVELVGEVTGLIESMALIASKKPDVWIHSWEEGAQLSATLSHLFSAHPDLAVIRINANESAGYIQMRVNSLPQLIRLATGSTNLLATA